MPSLFRSASVSACALAAALIANGPAFAQAPDTSIETSISEAAFHDPQNPDVYRALSGMGDPQVAATSDTSGEDFSTRDPKEVALLKRLFPGDSSSDDSFWIGGENCRLDQPLATIRARIMAFGAHSAYVQQWIRVQRAVFTGCTYSHSGQASEATAVRLPPPMITSDPHVAKAQREDRAYQAATALFYGRQMPQAAAAFARIAASRSDHRYYARYMAVAIGAGTQPNKYECKPIVPVMRALAEARTLEADPAVPAEIRRDAYDLIGWIGASNQGLPARQAQVDQTMRALEAPLALLKIDDEAQRRYADARDTRQFLFSSTEDAAALWTGDVPSDLTGTRAMLRAAQTDRFAEWMVFPHSPWESSNDHTDGAPWATGTNPKGAARVRSELAHLAPDPGDAANPWAHEALMWSDRYNPALWGMVDDEAEARTAHDPRAVEIAGLDFYHQARTAIMAGGAPGFEATLSHLTSFSDRGTLVWTTTVRETLRFLMVDGRINEARRVRDQLALVERARADDVPRPDDAPYQGYTMRDTGVLNLLILLAEDEDHLAPLLSDRAYDQAPLFNRLSIDEMRRLAARGDVAMEWRSALDRTAWTRTYALGRVVDPDLDRQMRALNPDITAHWLSRAGRPIRPEDRLALQDVLVTPGFNTLIDEYGRHRKTPGVLAQGILPAGIDHNKNDDDDWWCPWNPEVNDDLLDAALATTLADLGGDSIYHEPGKPSDWDLSRDRLLHALRSTSFLLRSVDEVEIGLLTKIRSAPELLTERTIDWVEHPGMFGKRAGQANALAAAIVTTRWGCDWAGAHGVYSHAALTLLHTRFPDTDAAKRVRYWYNCNDACRTNDDGHPVSPRVAALPAMPTLPAAAPRGIELVERVWGKPALAPFQLEPH